jgi:glutathione S-transferase
MTDTILYYGFETCARVTMTALEQIGVAYTATRIDLAAAEQRSPEYLSINPNAEVPALLIHGRTLTQNAAILHYLNAIYPSARLLPSDSQHIGLNEPLEDLLWCATTLHTLRRQVLNPARFTVGSLDEVRAKGLEGWTKVLPRIEQRLSARTWWYGAEWSVIDVYINWAVSGLLAGKLDVANRPALLRHEQQLAAHPASARALLRERNGQSGPIDISKVIGRT